MDPLLHAGRLFVCLFAFQGKWRVSCPPERERRGVGAAKPSLTLSATMTKCPGSEERYPAAMKAPTCEQARSQRDDYISQHVWSVSLKHKHSRHQKPQIEQLSWDCSLLSGPTVLSYILIAAQIKEVIPHLSTWAAPVAFPINQFKKQTHHSRTRGDIFKVLVLSKTPKDIQFISI